MMASKDTWVRQRIKAARGETPALGERTAEKFQELLSADLQGGKLSPNALNEVADSLLGTLLGDAKKEQQ